MTEASGPVMLHGVAVVVRDAGILLRGRSGAGKSRLAEELVGLARAQGWVGRHVSDDRVQIATRGGRVLLTPHPAIAGLVERRGQGVFAVSHEHAAVLRLVIDLVDRRPGFDGPPRFPEESEKEAAIGGVAVPRLALPAGEPGAARLAIERIAEIGG